MIRHLVKELLAERGNLTAEFRVWILKVKPMSDIRDDFRCWLVSKYCLKRQIMICFHLWNFSFKKLIYGKLDLSFTFGFFYLSFPRMENALISQLTNWGQGKKIQSPRRLRGGPESGRRNTHASSIAAGGPGSRSPAPVSTPAATLPPAGRERSRSLASVFGCLTAWHFKTGLPHRPFLWDGERRRVGESMWWFRCCKADYWSKLIRTSNKFSFSLGGI